MLPPRAHLLGTEVPSRAPRLLTVARLQSLALGLRLCSSPVVLWMTGGRSGERMFSGDSTPRHSDMFLAPTIFGLFLSLKAHQPSASGWTLLLIKLQETYQLELSTMPA